MERPTLSTPCRGLCEGPGPHRGSEQGQGFRAASIMFREEQKLPQEPEVGDGLETRPGALGRVLWLTHGWCGQLPLLWI